MKPLFNAINARELERQVRERKPFEDELRRILAEIELRIEGGAVTFVDLLIGNHHIGNVADRLREIGFDVDDSPENFGATVLYYSRKRVSWGAR